MHIKVSVEKFIRLFLPTIFSSRVTYQAYKPELKKIIGLSGFATLLEAMALLLVYALILIFTNKPLDSVFDIAIVNDFLSSPLSITILCGLLLALAVKIKHATFAMTIVVSKNSGSRASRMALMQARKIFRQENLSGLTQKQLRTLVLVLTRDFPFACGFAARGSAFIAIHLIQAVILCAILVYLSPLLTVFVLAVALVVITYLSTSFETVLDSNVDRRQNMSSYRAEVAELASSLADLSKSETDFSYRVELALTSGSTTAQLASRLSARQERQTGSLIIEYIYPAAIIAISLMYIYLGDFAPDITQVALYFLLTRQVIISLYGVGKVFMSLSKHHESLSSFMHLMDSGILPIELNVDNEQVPTE